VDPATSVPSAILYQHAEARCVLVEPGFVSRVHPVGTVPHAVGCEFPAKNNIRSPVLVHVGQVTVTEVAELVGTEEAMPAKLRLT
jgi:hypothetical protein